MFVTSDFCVNESNVFYLLVLMCANEMPANLGLIYIFPYCIRVFMY